MARAVLLRFGAHLHEPGGGFGNIKASDEASQMNHRVPTTGLGFSLIDPPGDIRPLRPDDSTHNPLWRSSSAEKAPFYGDFREFPPKLIATPRQDRQNGGGRGIRTPVALSG